MEMMKQPVRDGIPQVSSLQKLSLILWLAMLFLSYCSYSTVAADVECEELAVEQCAFAVSSSGARCVLEKQVSSSNSDPDFRCQTSIIMAERQTEWIETDECIEACGLQRMSVGLSTDAFLEADFTNKFCFSECRHKCSNIDDLYTKLAAGEGIYLPSLCEALKKKAPRKLMVPGGTTREGRMNAELINAAGTSGGAAISQTTSLAAAPAPAAAVGIITVPSAAPAPAPLTIAAVPSPAPSIIAGVPSPAPSTANGNNDYYVQQGTTPVAAPAAASTTTASASAPAAAAPSPVIASPPPTTPPTPAPITYNPPTLTPAPAPAAVAVDYFVPVMPPASASAAAAAVAAGF